MEGKKRKTALNFTKFVEKRVAGSLKKWEDTIKVGLTEIYIETVKYIAFGHALFCGSGAEHSVYIKQYGCSLTARCLSV